MSGIMEDVQNLTIGTIIELYDIDLTVVGYNEVLRYTPHAGNATSIKYGGYDYLARGIEMTGFSKSGQDAPAEPTLTITNVDKVGNALLASYDNLIGAKVTRRRTLSKYLDLMEDGVTPNPSASWSSQFMPEIWYVEQKQEGNRILIQWRMSSSMNLDGVFVPARRVLKSYCERRYRYYDTATSTFKYPLVNACPYTGTDYFDRSGNVTANPALDQCDKSHVGCGLRFAPEGLPTWAFPGADRIPG